jgi:hypothetical protein
MIKRIRRWSGTMLCRVGRHNRSRRRARRVATGWISHCKRCDVRMHRRIKGRWTVND